MRTRGLSIFLIALVFMAVGVVWMGTIYERCLTIAPARRLLPSIDEILRRDQPPPGGSVVTPVERRFRSPHARWYYFAGFWAIAVFELIVAFLFVLGGWALLRRYRQAWRWAVLTLTADVTYKAMVIVYMHTCALPLSTLIKNPVSVIAYYQPDKTIFSVMSGFFSGLAFYPPQGNFLGGAVYLMVMAGLFYWFSRDVVRA